MPKIKARKSPVRRSPVSRTATSETPSIETAPITAGSGMEMPSYQSEPQKKRSTKAGIILLLLILAGVFLVKKGYIVAAMVNGRPIYTWTLNSALVKRFGQQTLEGMVTEQLIYQEADKNGVRVTADEVQARENELVKSVGSDVKLEDLLKFQGLTREDFDNQVRLQLTVEKILGKDIKFTDAQLDNYIATNSASFTASDSATQRSEAKKALTEAEINNSIQQWVADLKSKAKVVRML
jgi:hypothetical protein